MIEIKPAKRKGAKLVLGISGVSGSGKTKTALEIAKGLAGGDMTKVGFLDTENKRGSLYADGYNPSYMIADMHPPFSPLRYAEAIKAFAQTDCEVLVIDSATHEWEGEGGCEDIANLPLSQGKKMADWKRAKFEHKKFMNALLLSDMHVIVCLRAREKTDFKNPKKPVSLGIQPICEKNFMFEMTGSLMMHEGGTKQDVVKSFEGFLPTGRHEGYLKPELGQRIRQWVDGGEVVDEVETARNTLVVAAQDGIEALEKAAGEMSAAVKKKIGKAFYDQMVATAQANEVVIE